MSEAVETPRRRRWRSWLWKLPLVFVAFSVLQVLVLRVVDPPFSTFMVARQMDAVFAGDFKFRIAHDWRDLDEMSSNLPLALVASEDQNFASHNGFDFKAIEKARANNAKGRKVRGASTISQQLAKNLFLDGERHLLRKAQEFVITFMLEALLSKRRILEIYLNHVEWGEGLFGAQAAARHYFRIDARRLGAMQAARLAVMLPAPKRFERRPGSGYLTGRAGTIAARMGAVQPPR